MVTNANFSTQAHLDKFNRLVEVSLTINSTLQLEPLLRFIMDTAAEIAEAEAASILLMDEDKKELHFMAFTTDSSIETSLKKIPVPLNNSVAGSVVQENKAIIINDASTDARVYKQADSSSGFHTESLIAIPMRNRDRVMGVLEAVNKKNKESWTSDDQHFLEILASMAGIAIENAALVRKLRQAYDDLSHIDKLKNSFIAIASHELRTPLGVILGYATFLQEESQGDASDHASAVMNSALKMRQIIEDMTNLRFLKIGEAELNTTDVPVSAIMMASLNDIKSMADAHNNRLHFVVPPEDVRVNGDKEKLTMALSNVLNNAVKYSPENSLIEFTYELHDQEIWIQVKDQGVGIPSDKLKIIFHEFYQVEDHMTRRHGGMGLGLAISNAIAEASNGRMWADSPGENQGTTITLCLPIAT